MAPIAASVFLIYSSFITWAGAVFNKDIKSINPTACKNVIAGNAGNIGIRNQYQNFQHTNPQDRELYIKAIPNRKKNPSTSKKISMIIDFYKKLCVYEFFEIYQKL